MAGPPSHGGFGEDFRDALGKLTLNDASLFYEPETSDALGFGFRCGFLGMLHMEIIQERLEREYNLDLITTAPTVIYEIVKKSQETIYVDNPSKLPDVADIEIMREPIARCTILTPQEYLGAAITLCVVSHKQSGKGSINFKYSNLDELERIIAKLKLLG